MRKTDFCLCENKGADQFHSNCKADQCLGFHYLDGTIPPLPISKISSFWPFSVTIQTGLCGACMETLKTGFLMSRLIYLNDPFSTKMELQSILEAKKYDVVLAL